MLRTLLALGLLTGCCNQGGECPDQAIAVVVSADGAGVEGVVVSGDLALECVVEEGGTTCIPTDAVTVGDYALVVEAPGHAPIDATLRVRFNQPPAYSCECEVREGLVAIELDPPAEPDIDAGM